MAEVIQFAALGAPLVALDTVGSLGGDREFSFDRDATPERRAEYDAVFVFSDASCRVSAEAVAGWIGHPHLRVIAGDTEEEQRSVLLREIDAVLGTEECERKFLIGYPDVASMQASPFCAEAHIVQTYLVSEAGVTERVRMRESDGRVTYTHTVKRRIDRQTSEELEREIDGEEYRRLLGRADGAHKPIEKTRWCILHAGQYFELDVYPFWGDRAVVELETAGRSDGEIAFPPYFRVIREVTDDVRYKNVRLALEVPYDDIG